MTTEFWNKQTPINGVSAETILSDTFFANARSIFLVKEGDTVTRIESLEVIRSNNKLGDLTDEQIVEWYVAEDQRLSTQNDTPPFDPDQSGY